MLKDNEKKIKMFNLRKSILIQMKQLLEGYQILGDEEILKFVKELGKDSEKLKKKIDSLK